MNIGITLRNVLSKTEKQEAKELAEEFSLQLPVAELLVARGVKSHDDYLSFINFEACEFHDPYLLSGLKEVTERLKTAVKNKERILVYGDYDADGICAIYILINAIKMLDNSADVLPYIPNRAEGYGLNDEAIESIAENLQPDLILTCDLGISCKEEVETIFDLGIDVLVSDHHELPNELPNCPCINPKLDIGKYPFTDLCGAGVVFKIAQALVPDRFMELVEFAAIATVADSVSLKGENRAIVKAGLKKMNDNPSASLKALIDGCKISGEITSSTIAFIIAPRINASGRMGIALRSLNMFMSKDAEGTAKLVEEINADNALRQKSSDEIFKECYREFSKNPDNYACVLTNENWQSGLLGIVASKLTEEFHRPTILFSSLGDNLRGSGRSIEGVNLFKMLSTMTDLFVTFGGHAQACGLTIKKSDFNELKKRIEEYLKTNVPVASFIPSAYFDVEEDGEGVDISLVKQLSVLEPFGVGNPKPVFHKQMSGIMVSKMKNYPQHLVGEGEHSYLLAFQGGKYIDVLRGNVKKNLLLDYSINTYKEKDYLKANIKEFYTEIDDKSLNEKELILDYLFNIDFEYYEPITKEDYLKLFDKAPFGILSVSATLRGYETLKSLLGERDYIEEGYAAVVKSNFNKLLLSPKSTVNFDKYKYLVFEEDYLNMPFDALPSSVKAFTLKDSSYIKDLKVAKNREMFVECYKAFKSLENSTVLGYNNLTVPLLKNYRIDEITAMTAYAVFKELGLITVENGVLNMPKGKKVDLNASKLYQSLKDE